MQVALLVESTPDAVALLASLAAPLRPGPPTRTSSGCRSRSRRCRASSPTCSASSEDTREGAEAAQRVAGRAERAPAQDASRTSAIQDEAHRRRASRSITERAVRAGRAHAGGMRAAAAARAAAVPGRRPARRRPGAARGAALRRDGAARRAHGRPPARAARALQPGLRRLRARQLRPRHPGVHASTCAHYPDTDLTDNAQYWIGECLYSQAEVRRGDRGLGRRCSATIPSSDKLPDARFKKGMALERLGRRQPGAARVPLRRRPLPQLRGRRASARERNSDPLTASTQRKATWPASTR